MGENVTCNHPQPGKAEMCRFVHILCQETSPRPDPNLVPLATKPRSSGRGGVLLSSPRCQPLPAVPRLPALPCLLVTGFPELSLSSKRPLPDSRVRAAKKKKKSHTGIGDWLVGTDLQQLHKSAGQPGALSRVWPEPLQVLLAPGMSARGCQLPAALNLEAYAV